MTVHNRFLNLSDAGKSSPKHSHSSPLRVLLLADDRHVANVVQDHIESFSLHSRHVFRVINPIHAKVSADFLEPPPDAVIVHYSIYILGDYFLPAPWREFLRLFPGPKAQIIQDEYRHIKPMKARMAELGIKAVFSSLDRANLPKVYGGDVVAGIRFYSCLPGYVADGLKTLNPPPIADRPIDVVYRGRHLPFHYGRDALEKVAIGDQMQVLADEYGLRADITSSEERRVYGRGWNNFLMSARATLGVEGGASIFDLEDEIEAASNRYIMENPGADFDEVWQAVLAPHEGNVVHRTLTPKLLEAVAAKTALVLYPGEYRGVLKRNRHYIPFERDGSNAEEVVRLLKDTAYLQDLVDRTYDDLIDDPTLSFRFYVGRIDAVLDELRAEIRLSPELHDRQRKAAVEAAAAAQSAADERGRIAEAEARALQARIASEHAALVRKQQEEMRRAAEAAALEQARIEEEHAEAVRRQKEEMRLAAETQLAKQRKIEAEHAAFVRKQEEEMRRLKEEAERAAAEQARIEAEHAALVRKQQEEMRQAAEAAALEQARIEAEHAAFVRKQEEDMRRAAEAAAIEQARIEAEHQAFVKAQLEEMRLAAEAATAEQKRIKAEHRAFVRSQKRAMRVAAQTAPVIKKIRAIVSDARARSDDVRSRRKP